MIAEQRERRRCDRQVRRFLRQRRSPAAPSRPSAASRIATSVTQPIGANAPDGSSSRSTPRRSSRSCVDELGVRARSQSSVAVPLPHCAVVAQAEPNSARSVAVGEPLLRDTRRTAARRPRRAASTIASGVSASSAASVVAHVRASRWQLRHDLTHLDVLVVRAGPQILGDHRAPGARGDHRGAHDGVLDVAAGHVEPLGERVEVDAVVRARSPAAAAGATASRAPRPRARGTGCGS